MTAMNKSNNTITSLNASGMEKTIIEEDIEDDFEMMRE